MKKLTILFLILFPATLIAQQMNIASFNIRMNTPKDGINAWPNRIEMVTGLLKFHDVEIFGLQEAFYGQINDIQKELLLSDKEPYKLENFSDDISAKAEIIDYKKDKVTIRAELSNPGYLVLLDAYYPGWRVSVNGSEKEILKAYEGFRAVRVEGGISEIVFQYKENSFKMGLSISMFGLFLLILSLFLKRYINF